MYPVLVLVRSFSFRVWYQGKASDDDKPEISRVIRPFPPWKLESGLNISFNKQKGCSLVFAGKELITPFPLY